MPSSKSKPRKTPIATKEQAAERYALMDNAIRAGGYRIDELESALGMYMMGFHYGWKVLQLIHSKKTIKKYETLLGIKITEVFDEFGPDADRTNAYALIQAASNFWKLVSGDDKPALPIDKRELAE